MPDRYKITQKEGIHFVTSMVIEWLPIFRTGAYFDLIIQSLKYCQNNKEMKLYSYVILDDHFHLVASAQDLKATLGALRRFTAHEIINQLKKDNKQWLLKELAFFKRKHKTQSDYQVWQEGFHPKLIITNEMLIQKVEYCHLNPVRRGIVRLPEHWRYSLARNYILDDHSTIQIDALPV